MNEIFRGKFLALYNQIGLYDTEDRNSYPQWETGLELAIIGEKGVAVSAKGDTYVEVVINENDGETENMILYAQGEIYIGKQGITVGNEISASTEHLTWEAGKTLVSVYGNNSQNNSTMIVFILQHCS